MRTHRWSFAAAALAFVAGARGALALDVGDRAPELDVAQWVQGEPAKIADGGGKLWLVVLWGTFESDCVDAMPALNSVFEKYKEKGLEIAAISTEPADTIRTFLGHHKLDYRVASDPEGKVTGAYGEGVKSLPMSWLVDKAGVVVWKGGPGGAGRIVEEVLAGRFDMARAKEVEARQQEMWDALWRNDWAALGAAAEKILDADPADAQAFSMRMWAFRVKDDHAGFKAFMKKHLARVQDDASTLASVARELGTGGSYEWRDVATALDAARRAVELSKSKDADTLSTYAHILFTIGLGDQAVEQQKKAVAADEKNESRKQVLAYYEACVAARKKAAPAKR